MMAEPAATDGRPLITTVTVGVAAPTESAARAIILCYSAIALAAIEGRDPMPAIGELVAVAELAELPPAACDALLQVREHVNSVDISDNEEGSDEQDDRQ
jgi:hypothetical protein